MKTAHRTPAEVERVQTLIKQKTDFGVKLTVWDSAYFLMAEKVVRPARVTAIGTGILFHVNTFSRGLDWEITMGAYYHKVPEKIWFRFSSKPGHPHYPTESELIEILPVYSDAVLTMRNLGLNIRKETDLMAQLLAKRSPLTVAG